MTTWQSVLTAALLGTHRAANGRDGTIVTVSGGDPAVALLDQAAVLTAARRAGRLPGQAEPLAAPEADERPVVAAAAGRRLARILAGEHPDLLPEWLAAAITCGLRPPPHLLPALLDRVRRVPASAYSDPDEAGLRALVVAAGGPLVPWLAGLNRQWALVLAEPPAAPGPPEYLSAAQVAQILQQALKEITQSPLTASRAIRLAARRADPALGAPAAMAEFPPNSPQALHDMLTVLRFRYEMLKEFDGC
jgi:hypothetical protein